MKKYRSMNGGHTGVCEQCQDTRPTGTTFDHCHKHGWVRGEVCHVHNMLMRDIDRGMYPQQWGRWQVIMWLRCPDCAATVEGLFLAAFVDQPEFEQLKRFMSDR